METGISVVCMFSRMGDFIPGSDKKTTMSAPPVQLCLVGGARQGWGHMLLVMVVFKSDPGPLKSNVICHATTRLEIEFPASTHGHGRFYIRPPYV